jgi:hypothetical protein
LVVVGIRIIQSYWSLSECAVGPIGSDSWKHLEALVALDFWNSDDVMVGGHLLWYRRSAVKMYADDFDILLMVPLQSCFQSSRRLQVLSF